MNPLRLLVLLLVALGVAIYVQEQRLSTTNWAETIEVVIFPINGDGSAAADSYIASLSDADFSEVDNFLATQAQRYGIPEQRPFSSRVGTRMNVLPPPSPHPDDPLLKQIWWNLSFRWWTWRHTPDEDSNFRRVRVFAVYHEPGTLDRLPHSLGVQKGLLGLVHLFADRALASGNKVVIAHEILHTVGARDKYTPEGHPAYPAGFATPDQKPLFPQKHAEIMAGSIALGEHESVTAQSLRQCTIGRETALEIGWLTEG